MRHQIGDETSNFCDNVTIKVFWILTNHLDAQMSYGSSMQLACDHA